MNQRFTTISGFLSTVESSWTNPTALNTRFGDSWGAMSVEEMTLQISSLAAGLQVHGLRKGEAVGILAPSSADWLVMDMAVMAAGGVTVPMFSDLSPENLLFEVQDSAMRFLYVDGEDELSAADILGARPARILKDRADLEDDGALTCEILMRDGQAALDAGELVLPEIASEDLATIVYTSGSTGVPKGVEITHGNLMHQVHACRRCFRLAEAEPVVSCLPLAHIYERVVMYAYVIQGVSVYFADEIQKVGEILRDVKPTTITVVPRILEKVHARLVAGVMNGSWSTRIIGHLAIDFANEDEPSDEHHDLPHWISDTFVYRRFREALGGNLKHVIVGGSSLDEHVLRFLSNVGIPIYEGYGMTETTSVLSVNTPGFARAGTVGRAFPGTRLKISEQGEVLARGPGVTRGYHNNPVATEELFTEDGWLRTGDRGELDGDGYLTITGRVKDLFKTSQGKYVSPVPIEQQLCRNALIENAMVIGENQRFVACLLFPELDMLRRVKQAYELTDLSDRDCLEHPKVLQSIDEMVSAVNEGLNHWEQIRKYTVLLRPLTVAGGELTPTMKIRRHVVADRFAAQVTRMYESDIEEGMAVPMITTGKESE